MGESDLLLSLSLSLSLSLNFIVVVGVKTSDNTVSSAEYWLPRWSNGHNCDSRGRGLGFDSRVGQRITGLFYNLIPFSLKKHQET
ncbi:hypothetical protein SFRURICE_003303, partial [Spodoptera frugiperda]